MSNTLKNFLYQPEITNATEWLTGMMDRADDFAFPFSILTTIDHNMASALYAINARNRPVRERRVQQYRGDMSNHRWHGRNGESYIITADRIMDNGQHRCLAIIDTPLRVDGLIVFGAEAGSELTVDQHAPKTVGDYLTIQGNEHGPTVSRICKLRLGYDVNEGEELKDFSKFSPSEVLEYYESHKENIDESAKVANELQEYTRRIVTPSIVGFVHNVIHEIDAEAANRYIEQVAKGEELKEGDPAYAVRNRLLKMGKGGARDKSELLFTGWNAFHSGRPLRNVRITGRLPRLQ